MRRILALLVLAGCTPATPVFEPDQQVDVSIYRSGTIEEGPIQLEVGDVPHYRVRYKGEYGEEQVSMVPANDIRAK